MFPTRRTSSNRKYKQQGPQNGRLLEIRSSHGIDYPDKAQSQALRDESTELASTTVSRMHVLSAAGSFLGTVFDALGLFTYCRTVPSGEVLCAFHSTRCGICSRKKTWTSLLASIVVGYTTS